MRAWWICLRHVSALKYAEDGGRDRAKRKHVELCFSLSSPHARAKAIFTIWFKAAHEPPLKLNYIKRRQMFAFLWAVLAWRALWWQEVCSQVFTFSIKMNLLSARSSRSLLKSLHRRQWRMLFSLLFLLHFSLRSASASASVCFPRCATLSAASLWRAAPRCLHRWWSEQINLHHPIDHINSSNPLFAKQIENNFFHCSNCLSFVMIVCARIVDLQSVNGVTFLQLAIYPGIECTQRRYRRT